jgi:dihydroxyacid dehydratase/phosphogluconate dehydratase
VPTIVDLMPSGRFLMEDFCYAGGIPAVMKEMADLLDLDALTVTGKTIARTSTARPTTTASDPPARQGADAARRHGSSCAAIWRPTAPSSSRRPPRRS